MKAPVTRIKQAFAPLKKGELRVIVKDEKGIQTAFQVSKEPIGVSIISMLIGFEFLMKKTEQIKKAGK